MTTQRTRNVATPTGAARVHLHQSGGKALLVLGHGAGGGVTAPDLQSATQAALETGFDVALVEQPYRVAGRKSPAPAARLDEAWQAVIDDLRDDRPLVTGGRSSGARVACRTAAATGAQGVLCLAFPVHPPGQPEKTRLPELDGVEVPVLVVQGDKDPFGMPPPAPGREVVTLQGDHGLKKEHARLREAVAGWLGQFV